MSYPRTAKDASGISQNEDKRERKVDDWVIEIKVMLGCVTDKEVMTCSISKVPETLRKEKMEAYSPKIVSMGPHHRTTTESDLQLMEHTKWRYMINLLRRATEEAKDVMEKLESCSEAIRGIDLVVRACYGGDIKLNPEELARIMILDGCYLLELLLLLYDRVTQYYPYPEYVEEKAPSDLTMLENQIPFIVLKKLYEELSKGNPSYVFPSFNELAEFLFDYHVYANSSIDVFHFLHLMHKSSIYNNNEGDSDKTVKEATQELKRSARKLRASGIKILAGTPVTSNIGLNKFVDKFDMNIKFDEDARTLTIPPLRIKEGTEVKWRNLIAWEQSGIDKIGYNFTTYASFFSALIYSVHDIKQLRDLNIIIVDDPKMRDEDLLAMFRTMVNGVQKMDSRYSELCEGLNDGVDCEAILRPRMWWHYCRRILEWLHMHFRKWIIDFRRDYMPNPWVFMGVIAAAILLGLTIAQTVFAALGRPKEKST